MNFFDYLTDSNTIGFDWGIGESWTSDSPYYPRDNKTKEKRKQMITVTAKDALKAEVVEPGIKTGECTGYKPDLDKNGAALHKFEVEVDFKGQRYPLQDYMISEKAVSMGKNFFIACGFPADEWDKLVKGEKTAAVIDPNSCVGKKFRVNVINDVYNGRITSKAGDFLPPV